MKEIVYITARNQQICLIWTLYIVYTLYIYKIIHRLYII